MYGLIESFYLGRPEEKPRYICDNQRDEKPIKKKVKKVSELDENGKKYLVVYK